MSILHYGVNARIWMMDRNPDPERPHAKKKELDELYEKSEEIGDPSFWDSDEVKSFIEDGDNDFVKCDNCGRWSDEIFQNGSMSKFQRCARCKNVFCKCVLYSVCLSKASICLTTSSFTVIESDCSRECQKRKWKTHPWKFAPGFTHRPSRAAGRGRSLDTPSRTHADKRCDP